MCIGAGVGVFVELRTCEEACPARGFTPVGARGPADPIRAGSSGSSLLGADRVGEGDARGALGMPVDVAVVALQGLALDVEGVIVLVKKLDP